MITCLNTIIGIKSSTGLPNPPTNFDQSDSGLFILEHSYNSIIKDGCETDNLLEMSDRAKSDAIKETIAQLMVSIRNEHKNSSMPFDGLLGRQTIERRKDIDTLTQTETYLGLLLKNKQKVDSKITLNRVGLWINESGVFTVDVYQNDTLIDSHDVVCVADEPSFLDLSGSPVELILSDQDGDYDYSFVYQRGTSQPYNNKIFRCDCSRQGKEDKNRVANYAEVVGIEGNDINDLRDWGESIQYSYGVILDCSIKCDKENLLCRNYTHNEDWATVLSYAVLYKAIANLIQQIIDENKINILTLLNKEQLYGKRNHFKKEWLDRVDGWLPVEIDYSLSGCFECQDDYLIGKKLISATY